MEHTLFKCECGRCETCMYGINMCIVCGETGTLSEVCDPEKERPLTGLSHTPYICPKDCRLCDDQLECPYCNWNLVKCSVCHNSEGELTTHCPGEPVGEIMKLMILMGQADYVNGNWIRPNVVRETRFT